MSQRYPASYRNQTGLIDTAPRPTFGGGGVTAVAASPDGTKLYVAGSFTTINGVTKRKIADQDRYGVGLISTQTNQLLPWGRSASTTAR